MKNSTISLLLAAGMTIPSFLPAAVYANNQEDSEDAVSYISQPGSQKPAGTQERANHPVPSNAVRLTDKMNANEVNELLNGANYVVLTKGNYSRFSQFEFMADTIYVEDGVVMSTLILDSTDMVGVTAGAKLTLNGSLQVKGAKSVVEDLKIDCKTKSNPQTEPYMKDGRLNWTGEILNFNNCELTMQDNDLGPGLSCGNSFDIKVKRTLTLSNTTLNLSGNKGHGIDAAAASNGTMNNLFFNIKDRSIVTLEKNTGSGFNGGMNGTVVNLTNSNLNASGNDMDGLTNVLLTANKTSQGTYTVAANHNVGNGMGVISNEGKSSLSASGYSVNVLENQKGGLVLDNPQQPALSLTNTTLKAMGNKNAGLTISAGSVSANGATVNLTDNGNQGEETDAKLKELFSGAVNSVVYTTSANTPLINTLAGITVTFSANGGTFKDGAAELKVSGQPTGIGGSAAINVTDSVPTREGYVFKQWNTKEDGSGDKVSGTITVSGNTTIYAIWREKSALKPIEDPNKPLTVDPETGGQWVYTEDGQYMYRLDGVAYIKNDFMDIGGKIYYFNDQGLMVLGLQKLDGATYFFNVETGEMRTGWVDDQGDWYYFGENGKMQTGWTPVNNTWYYLNPSDGTMKTGWLNLDGKTFYLDKSGAMKTRWLLTEGKWYFFYNNGEMAKEQWVKDGDKWYYLDSKGSMLSSTWLLSGGKRYWLDHSGAMKTDWLLLNGKWYLFSSDGVLITNQTVNGYILGADGVCQNPDSPIQ